MLHFWNLSQEKEAFFSNQLLALTNGLFQISVILAFTIGEHVTRSDEVASQKSPCFQHCIHTGHHFTFYFAV